MTYDELVDSILTAKEEMLKHKIEANSVTLNGRKYGKLIEDYPLNIKPTIFGMAVKAEYALPDDYDFLVQYEPPQPATNADRIRAMTDEELADFIARQRFSTINPIADMFEVDVTAQFIEGRKNMLNWLKQGVDDAD